jgi:FixH
MSWIKSDKLWPYGVVVAMIAFVAIQHRPQLVSDHYYAEGFNLREIQKRQAVSTALGWQIEVQSLPKEQAAIPLVQLTVRDAMGAVCDSLTGQVALYRPSDQALDIESRSLFPIGAGKYLAKVPRPLERGLWQAVTHLERGVQTFDTRISFFVEP